MQPECKRINRIMRIMSIMSVSLRIIGLKSEFLNIFVSVTKKRIMRIMFTCVPACLYKTLLIFKDKKIYIVRPARSTGQVGDIYVQ